MSIIGSELLLGAADEGGFIVERSLKGGAGKYLNRTPSVAGNRRTWTFSQWIKLGEPTSNAQRLLCVNPAGGTNETFLQFQIETSGIGVINNNNLLLGGASKNWFFTNAEFIDSSSWYHIVLAVDTTLASSADRFKLWINNELQTFRSYDPGAQNDLLGVNGLYEHQLNTRKYSGSTTNWDFRGYRADTYLIDGQALDPTNFAEYDDNGQWQPIEYTGSYGTNGFYLNFSDNSSVSALGTDYSGNGNNYTVNAFVVSPSSSTDSVLDSPSNGTQADTGAGGEVTGNYCVFEERGENTNLQTVDSNLSLKAVLSGDWWRGTFPATTGKWYFEVTGAVSFQIGIRTAETRLLSGPGRLTYENTSGAVYFDGSSVATWSTAISTDILGVAYDLDNYTFRIYKNNTLLGTYNYGTSIQGKLTHPVFYISSGTMVGNFGQRTFTYTAPSGYKALCTANLPDPSVPVYEGGFIAKTYTGNSSTQVISNFNFSPDFVWIKCRDVTYSHRIYDIIRGPGYGLRTDSTSAQANDPTSLTAFNSDGFTLGGAVTETNFSPRIYASWSLDAGSSTVTNNSGTISSQVRANTDLGFSIVQFTGNNTSNQTVGHGLGKKPDFILARRYNSSSEFPVWHNNFGNGQGMRLTSPNAIANLPGYWNSTIGHTSSVVSIGSDPDINGLGDQTIMYCFAATPGFSQFGSYVGNNSRSGATCVTGFRPGFIIIKNRTTNATNWYLLDDKRIGYNYDNYNLVAETSAAEANPLAVAFLANGFKIISNGNAFNLSGDTFIYAAFATSPFKYSRAR